MIEGERDKRLITFWVIVVLLFCLAYFADRAEAQGYALDCLPPLTDPVLFPDHLIFPDLRGAPVPVYVMDALREVPSLDSFWVSTKHGYFAVPADIYTVLWIEERDYSVGFAVQHSRTTSMLYLTVFNTYLDVKGEHYDPHPCAAVLVDSSTFFEALATPAPVESGEVSNGVRS